MQETPPSGTASLTANRGLFDFVPRVISVCTSRAELPAQGPTVTGKMSGRLTLFRVPYQDDSHIQGPVSGRLAYSGSRIRTTRIFRVPCQDDSHCSGSHIRTTRIFRVPCQDDSHCSGFHIRTTRIFRVPCQDDSHCSGFHIRTTRIFRVPCQDDSHMQGPVSGCLVRSAIVYYHY